MNFKFAYFVERWMDYQPAKFQCCRLFLPSFVDKLRKTQLWRHLDAILCFWDLESSNFVKLTIGYHPYKFQISWLSGSNFIDISVRPSKTPLWRHFLSLCFQIRIFTPNFNALGCLDKILWRYNEIKSPVLIGLMHFLLTLFSWKASYL